MSPTATLEQANAELTLRLRQQELATAFANVGLQTEDLQVVLDEACRAACRGMGCRHARVLQHLPAQDRLVMRAGVGWDPAASGQAGFDAGPKGPAGHALRTGQPVLSDHLAAQARLRTPAPLVEHGVHRAFSVPIPTPDRPYGVLEVDGSGRDHLAVSDTGFLQSLAATLAHAIARQARVQELRSSETLAHGMLEASQDCVKVLGADGTLERMNAHGVCLLGLDSFADVSGLAWASLWPEEQRPGLEAALEGARRGEVGRFEGFSPTARGVPKWWDVTVVPIGGAGGRILAISRDITERVAAAEAKDLLMLEVHHRVKNSLQLVQGLLALQGRAATDGQAREQLLESAARVHTIGAIHDRLYQSGSALVVEVGPYLDGLVEDLQAGLASTVQGRSIAVAVDAVTWPASDLPTLGLVLTELVTNALKYGQGAITVTFRQAPGEHGVLTVGDEGPGLPAGFDPRQSRGLGMRLVNGLLRGDGAGLEVDRQGGQTRFIARMPPRRAFAV